MGGSIADLMGERTRWQKEACISRSDVAETLICVHGLYYCMSSGSRKSHCPSNNIKLNQRYEPGDRYFYFGGDNDKCLTLVDSWVEPNHKALQSYVHNSALDSYWLYTRKNPDTPQYLEYNDLVRILESNYDYVKPTIIACHGWISSANSLFGNLTRQAFLKNADVNVILIDWSWLASEYYTTSVRAVPKIGAEVGQFIKWLVSLGVSYENIHLVGHSLGAHLIANAGRFAGGKVKRLTGLDPAGPLYYHNPDRLNISDAQYVEVIHTNGYILGYPLPIGDVDHYPNGGVFMPGCGLSPICAHTRAYQIFASTVINDHLVSKECMSADEIIEDMCDGDEYPLGNSDLNKNGKGLYRVNTEADYPYI